MPRETTATKGYAMTRRIILPLFVLLLLSAAAASAAQPGKAPASPVIVEGYTLGMPLKDLEARAAKDGLTVANKAAIDSKYTQIVFQGKLQGFSKAMLYTVVAGGKLVNMTFQVNAMNDAEKAAIKTRSAALLKEWQGAFRTEPESPLKTMRKWVFADRDYTLFWEKDNSVMSTSVRIP